MKTEAGPQNKQKRNSKTNRPMNRKAKTEEPLKIIRLNRRNYEYRGIKTQRVKTGAHIT